MNKQTRLIIGIVTIVLIIGLWFRFWLLMPSANFEIGDSPIVSVNYHSNHLYDEDPKDIGEENNKHIADSAKVLSSYQPDIDSFYITSAANLRNYADFNLFWASDLEHFSPGVATIDTRDKTAKDLSNLFADPNFQQFVKLDSEQIYDLYISFDGAPPSSAEIVVGEQNYSLKKANDQFFKFSNFESGSHQFFGIKPAIENQKISQTVFITKKIESNDPIVRISSLQNGMFKVSRNKAEVNIPDNHFLFLKSPSNHYLVSDRPGKYKEISGFFYPGNNWTNSSLPTVNLNRPMVFIIPVRSGFYNVVDIGLQPREAKYASASLLLAIIGAVVIFGRQILNFMVKSPVLIAVLWQKFRLLVRRDQAEILIYFAIILLLLILRINPLVSTYLSLPILLAIISFFAIIYSRFSVRLISLMILIFTFLIAIICQTGYVVMQKSLEDIIFFFLFLAAIVLVVSKIDEKKNKHKLKKWIKSKKH